MLGSRVFRLLFSAGLIYFAFRKIDVVHLAGELRQVPWWFLVVMLAYFFTAMVVGAVRWMWLVLDKPKWIDVKNFVNATYAGSFYSLFFPSAVGGDVVKWLPLLEKYPQVSKTKIASSVLVDRIIGFSAFAPMAFISAIVGKIVGIKFPDYLLWFFLALTVLLVIFYVLVFTIDFEKWLGKWPIFKRILDILDVFKQGNKKRILMCLGLSLITEPIWILPNWFYSLIFGAGMSWLSIMVILPIINLIIILPISFAGFGARENLFVFFFSQLGIPEEKILLVSTFSGILVILNALLGGLISLI